jgi:type 1 glutamine amidotransferase
MICCAVPSARAAAPDCPAAHEPYSTRTVLLDLLINPATRTILERHPSGVLRGAWPGALKTTPPTFAALLTPRDLAKRAKVAESEVADLDRALAAVPVTPDASRARCARYDQVPPQLPPVGARPAILVFDKINGFRDDPSVNAAAKALTEIAAARGWSIVRTDNGAVFNPAQLKRFDAVVWNNVSGDALTLAQRGAFKAYIEGGGGFVGMHGSGGDPNYFWDWYADTLIGARFIGHPNNPQFQPARVVVEDRSHPATQGLGPEWTMTEEWYSFASSPRARGARVLASLDERSYSPAGGEGQNLRMGDHPIAWTRCIGRGRSFYTAIGHRPESYVEPHARKLLEQGIAWALGKRCAPSAPDART